MSTPAISTVTPIVPAVQFKNIAFATDFSEYSMSALPMAAALARKFGATLFLCHVVTPTPLAIGAPEAAPYLYQAESESAARALEALVKSPAVQGLPCKTLMAAGPLADELEAIIEANKIDLVIAGTHGRTGMRRLLLGSSVEQICRIANCPVLTVGPDLTPGNVDVKRILVPTDLSEESELDLPYVAQMVKAYGAHVTVLHVMPEDTASNPDARVLAEPMRRTMMHAFEGEIGDPKPDFVIEFGNTVETILAYARRNKTDLIAMGIRSAFLPGFTLRPGVAYRVIAGAHCPVLTCRR
jgi:nucleotide-binding universal stress UspA family protein